MAWLLVSPSSFGALVDPLVSAAEYYFSHQDYSQSLQVWNRILKKQPESLTALFRVSGLRLLTEGRGPSRDVILGHYYQNADRLGIETRGRLAQKLEEFQSIFFTDDGQSLYLRALPRMKHDDWQGSLVLLAQAAELEKGALPVLRAKWKCEKELTLYEKYYDTLKRAQDMNPFDEATIEELAEAHVYFRAFDKAVGLFQRNPENLRSVRERVAVGVALSQLGQSADAIQILQAIADKETEFHPIVFALLGQLLGARSDAEKVALGYSIRFDTASANPRRLLIDGWNPYANIKLTR